MPYTDFQTRVEHIHDNIRRKINDRNLELIGHLTDCIRVKVKTNREGDIETRIVESADIVHIDFPPMENVPVRELQNTDGKYTITSLVSSVGAVENPVPNYYVIQCPRREQLQVGELLFRVFMEPDFQYPIVLGLIVIEKLLTFGANSPILCGYNVNVYQQPLPEKMVDTIVEMAKRREYIKY